MIFDLMRKSGGGVSSREIADLLRWGSQASSGVAVTPETAMRFAPVFSCIRVRAEDIGKLPVHVFKRAGDRKEKDTKHPLYRLLSLAPNDYQTAQEFKEMISVHLDLRGNFYAFINRVGGKPAELLPLNPDAVEPKKLADHSIAYSVTFADGSRDVLTQDKIFHVRGISLDGVSGLAVITCARETIGLGIATERHGAKLFSNYARPGGILSTDGTLTDEALKRIKESWDASHGGGPDNAHRTAILEAGLKWTAVGMSSEDAQFLQTRKYQRSEIAGLFRVPPHKIGDLDRATFSNIEHQSLDYVDSAIVPTITRIEGRAALQLLTEAEQATHFIKFNVNALLRGDMTARSNYYTRMLQAGAMSPNEIRDFEDMNPRDGGDIFLTPMNMAINGQNPKEAGE